MLTLELSVIRQLVRLITRPLPESRKSALGAINASGDRCGCCPSCRAFVRIGPAVEGEDIPCPGCRLPIRDLEPLGSC